MAGEPIILWEEVDKRTPIAQDPDNRQQRKDLFKKLLPKSHKTLTLDDVQKGMKNELRYDMAGSYVPGVQEMKKIITYAFKASCDLAPPGLAKSPTKSNKKSVAKVDTGVEHAKSKSKLSKDEKEAKGKSVDRREFHAFLVALRYYLELAELFEECDGAHDDDQKLSYREVHKGQAKLSEWGVTEDMLKEKFAGVDAWVATMKFDDFCEWVMGVRFGAMELKLDDSDDEEVQFHHAHAHMKGGLDLTFKDLGAESDMNMIKVRETFAVWDSDNSGGISWEELAAVMKDLDPSFTEKKAQLLFTAADSNKDGLIDFDEFLAFVFSPESPKGR